MTDTILSNEIIKAEAQRLGFDICGLAVAEPIDNHTHSFVSQWLEEGKQAEMDYLNHYLEKRSDPRLLVEGTQTIVSVALNYYPRKMIPKDEYQIAWYAYGKDYHDIIHAKLSQLMLQLQKKYPALTGRIFCDTAPVLERYWAWKAGLGWIGKNTLLIIPQAGSCFFLGEMFLNLKTDKYDTPLPDQCGNCSLCMNHCPTGAIEAPHTINAGKCINYLTIENKAEIPPQIKSKLNHQIYGCNHCQEVCPWNRFATANETPELQPSEDLLNMTREDWESLSEERYKSLFAKSAIKRAKYKGLIRNIKAVSENKEPGNQ